MPKTPKGIKTTLDVINHHNRTHANAVLHSVRCVGCGEKIEPGEVLCDPCFKKWEEQEGKNDRRDK